MEVIPGDGRFAVEDRIGDYRIKALVGEGQMGEVYLAQDGAGPPGRSRCCAARSPSATASSASSTRRAPPPGSATRTSSRCTRLESTPAGPTSRSSTSTASRCGPGALAARCPSATRIVRAISEAIAEAHERGIIHADLKPENVIVPVDGRIRVVDFGLAPLPGAPATGASGTPSYMAPERWTSAAPTPAIDAWSIGVILHDPAALDPRHPRRRVDRDRGDLGLCRARVPEYIA